MLLRVGIPVGIRRRAVAAAACASVVAGLFAAAMPSARAAAAFTDEVIANPSTTEALLPLGHGRMAEAGSLSFVLYRTQYSWTPYAYVRDTASTAAGSVALPEGSTPGYWDDAAYAATTSGDLWTLSGAGPVYVRRYRLTGSPLPTLATLVSTTVFGDSDSRAGALTVLASGAVVGVWHQQGSTGPNGYGVAYWNGSAWSTQTLDAGFMPSGTSKQALVQHPADGSVWLFSNADSWNGVGAAHFTEASGALRLDWADGGWISAAKNGQLTADRENPDLEAAADPSTGTVVVAYQSDHRYTFSTSPVVTGSYPVLARVGATGGPSLTTLPVWVERVSALGLVVRPGEVWLAYRPIDTATLTWSALAVDRLATSTGAWDAPVKLGTAYDGYSRIGFGLSRLEFTSRMADGNTHRYSTQAASTGTTSSSTSSTSTTSTTTSTTTSNGKRKK